MKKRESRIENREKSSRVEMEIEMGCAVSLCVGHVMIVIVNEREGGRDGWMEVGWMNELMDVWINERMNEWIDGLMDE